MMIDDSLLCRCLGVSCVQGARMIDDCLFVDVVVFLVFREFFVFCRCQGVLLG